MIVELNIMNFAIMENITINFTEGFNIITGETGTGKSIVVEGLNMILGDRASKDMVKSGCEKAFIEGLFYIAGREDIEKKLYKYGLEPEETGYLLITREIYASGRSISRVNGRTITLSMLNDITKKLVDIHSQHEHQSLLNSRNHIELVDSFAREELSEVLDNISIAYKELKEKESELLKIDIDPVEKDRNLDLYRYQLDELMNIDLENYEEETIFASYSKLSNIKLIENNLMKINIMFKGEEYLKDNLLDDISKSIKKLEDISEYDDSLESFKLRLEEIYYNLDELSKDIYYYIDSISFNEEKYRLLGEKISYVEDLKRKYGPDISDVIIYRDKVREEIDNLENNEKKIDAIKSDIMDIRERLNFLSEKASSIRKKASEILTRDILIELKDLNMNNVDFKINFNKKNDFTSKGYDDVEFLISTNLGEQLKPLSKVVSGGEMSRIMLAFKSVFADYDNIETLIFDEIDSGISGMTAQLVGEKIEKIAKNHQVICISHLPQIASLADSHFLIEKKNLEKETQSFIKKLDYEERVLELSRLLGGIDVTKTTMEHAKEMLDTRK